MIAITCVRCSTTITARDDQAEAKLNCGSCGQRLQIPFAVTEPDGHTSLNGHPSLRHRRKRVRDAASESFNGL